MQQFRPVAPLSILHSTLAAEEVVPRMAVVKNTANPSLKYCGYIIPKGAIIFVNVCELSLQSRTPAFIVVPGGIPGKSRLLFRIS
jgi:ribosomal protein S8E